MLIKIFIAISVIVILERLVAWDEKIKREEAEADGWEVL